MSTPYPQRRDSDQNSSSMITQPPTPGTPVVTPDRDTHLHRPSPEASQGYRPAAPIQRFNNKSLNWPAWFRHFRAVADVHGWNKDQRALQLVSYLDETAINVAQELGDNDLYNYDMLVKLLSDRFDPASRVLAFRSRFHGRARRHHEDADTFADALAELCWVGYPLEPCAGLKVWPATAPPRSEEARTRTAQSFNAGARTTPQPSIFRPAPAPHRTMENVGPH